MANAQQLKSLIQSFVSDDKDQFLSVALQLAASEARKGHTSLARELKELVDQARASTPVKSTLVPLARPKGELADLLSVAYPSERVSDLILRSDLSDQLDRVLREQRNAAQIKNYGLHPTRKLLLVGPPGTGKTFTARVLAGELGLPLFVVRMDSIITKFMGESSSKLRSVFEAIANRRGVYLFDEFDSIGGERGRNNEVGEMRRILNTFLQLVEHDTSDSLIVAATNHISILDQALFRRFDDVLMFEKPDVPAVTELLRRRLQTFSSERMDLGALTQKAIGLSHAEITAATYDAIKDSIVHGKTKVDAAKLGSLLDRRRKLAVRDQASKT